MGYEGFVPPPTSIYRYASLAHISRNKFKSKSHTSLSKMPGGFHPPPSVIASWPTPNYVDPPTKGKGLFALSLILCIVAIILVGARLYVRGRMQRQLGFDDLFLAIGLVCQFHCCTRISPRHMEMVPNINMLL